MNSQNPIPFRPEIRLAVISDLEFIVNILNQAIQAGVNGLLTKQTIESKKSWFYQFNNNYPIYVATSNEKIVGICYLTPYRPGREAMSKVAEISYYVDYSYHQKGIASALINHVIKNCETLNKNSLLAILLDKNIPSILILEKFGFKKWGHFPNIINLNNEICSQLIYGLKLR